MKPRNIAWYGWKRDLPELGLTVKYADSGSIVPTVLPPSVDLRSKCPPVYDQSDQGSCTANAIAGAYEFDLLRQGITDFTPSRDYIYYNERTIEGTIAYDSGASISDSVKAIQEYGICPETMWDYERAHLFGKPTADCYAYGLQHKQITAIKVANQIIPSIIKMELAAGNPVIFGFTVYESFESDAVAKTGIVPMPQPNEQIVGGHAVMIVGYDDSKECVIVRNSWGADWGDKGYFYMPYKYVTNINLAADFWSIRAI